MQFLVFFLVALFATSCSSTGALKHNLPSPEFSQTKLRIRAVQYPLDGGKSLEALFRKLETFVRSSAKTGADLVVFPELVTFDAWPNSTMETEQAIALGIAKRITPGFFEEVRRLSKKYDVAILAGSTPRLVDGRVRNTAMLALPGGDSFLQDKVYLTAWERSMGWESGQRIETFNAPWGKTAILICYDIEFPALSQSLVARKPELLLVPSMTESESGLQRVRWSAQARAVEHHAFVVVSGTVGRTSKDWIHFGQNLVLSPRDTRFPEAPVVGPKGKTGVVEAVLDFEKLRKSRSESKFYPAKDQSARE